MSWKGSLKTWTDQHAQILRTRSRHTYVEKVGLERCKMPARRDLFGAVIVVQERSETPSNPSKKFDPKSFLNITPLYQDAIEVDESRILINLTYTVKSG